MEAQKELDTRGLNCPLPILKAKKALTDMLSGEVLKVVATDPGSVRDFQAFARQTGNELVEQTSGERRVRALPAAQVVRRSEVERLQVGAEARPELSGCVERQFHVGFQETFLAAAVDSACPS